MKKILLSALGASLLSAVALAQVVTVPQVLSVGTADLFADVVGGAPGAQSQYATAAQITSAQGTTYSVAVTGFSMTYGPGIQLIYLVPAGTLATGTVTTAVNPSNGQRMCIRSTQTQTALTMTANTGQTINTAQTALTAATTYCWVYLAQAATWYPI